MSTPASTAREGGAPAPLQTPQLVSASAGAVHLAPPLPPPPPDVRLLTAAFVVLAAAVVSLLLTVRRLRGAAAPAEDPAPRALRRLSEIRAAAECRGQCPARTPGTPGSPLCAEAVRQVLVEFAAATTDLPCLALTSQEIRDAAQRLPGDGGRLARVAEVLERCDECRFGLSRQTEGCLVDAAASAVRAWVDRSSPVGHQEPAGAGS